MKARIHWKTPGEGGRAMPPQGDGGAYAPIVRFIDAESPLPPAIAWSLVVNKIAALNQYEWIADVFYLVKEAPVSELRANRTFELLEGRKCVATGVLLESNVALAK
jgi:hypothetical protein